MKTRADIFYKSEDILNVITLYKALKLEQLINMYPNKENARHSINSLIKSRRVFYFPETDIVSSIEDTKHISTKLINAFWVMLDFIDKAEYHTISDFPVQILFFKEGELYEIIYVSLGEENLINGILNKGTDDGKRLIVIESKEQIKRLNIKNTLCYCEILDNKVSYFKDGRC